MKTNHPLITIILPVYNAERYLKKAILSIINQTYKNLEVICINDGSTDESEQIIRELKAKDSRIVYVKNEENIGLIKTLNKAIEIASGEYIARMDADDISLPDRIEKQYKFLKDNNVDICDCNIKYINENNKQINKSAYMPLTNKGLIFYSFFKTPLIHPTVFSKSVVLKTHKYLFSDITIHCEDYELWTRLINSGVKIAKMKDVLYIQNVNSESVSYKYEDIQKQNFTYLTLNYVNKYFHKNIAIDIWKYAVNRFEVVEKEYLNGAVKLLTNLQNEFIINNEIKKGTIEYKEIKKITNQQKLDIFIQAIKRNESIYYFLRFIFSKEFLLEFKYILNKRF